MGFLPASLVGLLLVPHYFLNQEKETMEILDLPFSRLYDDTQQKLQQDVVKAFFASSDHNAL